MHIAATRIARSFATLVVVGGAVLAAAVPASAATVRDGDPGTGITVDGARNGTLEGASTSCLGGGYWQFTGTLDGTPVDMSVTFSQGDPGVGTFATDTGLDPEHGLVALTVGDENYVTDSGGENTGTFTVDPGARSGSLDVRTSTTDQANATHVEGTWSCA